MIYYDPNIPPIFNESARHPQFVTIKELKGHNSQNCGLYGISLDEKVIFPSLKDLQKNPSGYIKLLDSKSGSDTRVAFVLVTRTNSEGKSFPDWFNLATLTRYCYNMEGHRRQIDPFRILMGELKDDYQRLSFLLGRTITSMSKIEAFCPEYNRELKYYSGLYIRASYDSISLQESTYKQKNTTDSSLSFIEFNRIIKDLRSQLSKMSMPSTMFNLEAAGESVLDDEALRVDPLSGDIYLVSYGIVNGAGAVIIDFDVTRSTKVSTMGFFNMVDLLWNTIDRPDTPVYLRDERGMISPVTGVSSGLFDATIIGY